MKTIVGSKRLRGGLKYPVLTLGNFDGVHRGHQKIIKKVISIAKRNGGTSILYTFDPHPVSVLAPKLTPPLLQTVDQKTRILGDMGLDLVVIEPFTKELAHFSAADFFENIVIKRIGAGEIVVGYDFTFGRHRSGKIEDLERMASSAGVKVHVIDAVFLKDTLISSTNIRHYIKKGDVESATAMLGRPHSVEGIVIKGRGMGAKLGFHTANLKTGTTLMPPPGVYITATTPEKSGRKYPSATNIGYNPTFCGTDLSIETYLLDFDGNLLKQNMIVEFYKKIRREMTFDSADDLRRQITKDIAKIRRYHEKGT